MSIFHILRFIITSWKWGERGSRWGGGGSLGDGEQESGGRGDVKRIGAKLINRRTVYDKVGVYIYKKGGFCRPWWWGLHGCVGDMGLEEGVESGYRGGRGHRLINDECYVMVMGIELPLMWLAYYLSATSIDYLPP